MLRGENMKKEIIVGICLMLVLVSCLSGCLGSTETYTGKMDYYYGTLGAILTFRGEYNSKIMAREYHHFVIESNEALSLSVIDDYHNTTCTITYELLEKRSTNDITTWYFIKMINIWPS